MTDKRKTLKDFKFTLENYMIREQIKAEAIKWVKRSRNPIYVELGEREFMKFHNITESDLK